MVRIIRSEPPALPATRDAWLAERSTKKKLTLVDHVDAIHIALIEDADYLKLLQAVHNYHAVTGKVDFDHYRATEMICDYASSQMDPNPLADAKRWDVTKALHRVLARFKNLSPRKRREQTNGRGNGATPTE